MIALEGLKERSERQKEEEAERLRERQTSLIKEREMERHNSEKRIKEVQMARERQKEEESVEGEAKSLVKSTTLEPSHESPKPESPSSLTGPITEPIMKKEEQPPIEVVYDDFSVKEVKPLIEVVYDDYSVKPRRWGSQARAFANHTQGNTPSLETEGPCSLSPFDTDLQRSVVDTQETAQDILVSAHPQPVEEDIEGGAPSPVDGMENSAAEEEEDEADKKEEDEAETKEEDEADKKEEDEAETKEEEEEEEVEKINLHTKEQSKCCVEATKGHDTDALIGGEPDALIGGEPDQQYEGCDTRLSEVDSPQNTVDHTSAAIMDEPNGRSPLEEIQEPLPFPEISATLLDNSVLRSRAELRKSRRTRPPRAVRQISTTATLDKDPVQDWRFCDSTDVKVDQGLCESDEEQPRERQVCSPPSQPQRIPLFPGLDPSILKAQLKKREGGEGVDTDRDTDRLVASPSQLSSSPGRSSYLPGATRVLPPVGSDDGGGNSSPSWLQELKAKKRLSQYNSET
ncbi:histone H3.v1 isoform X1 [Esox lucius]|uniref:histone H3.v1 isoform X1 n=1 Tax=Esox lucius TaxID=8010 RepID=UPI00147760C5|nr:histone H3.v1 isoform X1 [Esox lucius]